MRPYNITDRIFAAAVIGSAYLSGYQMQAIQAAPPAVRQAVTARSAGEGEIARNGVARAVIVLPASPLPVETYAAQELVTHIRLASGVTLPIVSENKDRTADKLHIYIGRCQATVRAGVVAAEVTTRDGIAILPAALSTAAPDTLEWEPSLASWSLTNRVPLDDSLEFTVDLGAPKAVRGFTFRNRPDAASNYSLNRIQIETGKSDDGKVFDELVYSNVPRPGLGDAAARRRADIKDSNKRFFRFRLLSNFWGAVAAQGAANGQSAFFSELSYLPLTVPGLKHGGAPRLGALPPNTFIVKSTAQSLFLVGRDDDGPPLRDTVQAGTLFATYEWLERQLGATWLWPGELGTSVPKQQRITAGRWNLRNKPPFIHTRLRQTLGRGWQAPAVGGFSEADRAAAIHDESVWYRRQRFARGISLDYDHAFHGYWDRFSKTHPEYFNLLPDGTRRPAHKDGPGNGQLVSMSVSDEGFQRQVIEDWKVYRTGFEPWIDGAENDANGLCVCPDCLRWDAPDTSLKFPWRERVERSKAAFLRGDKSWEQNLGSLSDRYARFWLELQKKGKAADPNSTVIGYAYANYWEPPRQTRLNRNIVVGIVPAFWWPLNDKTAQSFKAQWEGWSRTGASLYYRPNYMLSGYNQPTVYPHMIARDFSLAARHGLIATDFDSLTSQWATQGPNIYVVSRLHWHPQWPADRILDEYYTAFGPAKEQIKRYFEYWERLTAERGNAWGTLRKKYEHNSEMAIYQRASGELFAPGNFLQAKAMLAEAKRVAGAGTLAAKRIQFLETGLEDARLSAATTAAYWKAQGGNNPSAYAQALQELDKYRAQPGRMKNVANIDFSGWLEDLSWDRALFTRLAEHKVLQQLPDGWQLRWDPRKQGANDKWFTDFTANAEWQPIQTDAPWENQEAGKAWQKEHKNGYDGWAWYRVHFKAPSRQPGGRLALLFGAVDESATVWVNGRKVGEHPFRQPNDWQTPFTVDIEDAVKPDSDNELTVLVEDNSGAGGIYKPVWLVSKADGKTSER